MRALRDSGRQWCARAAAYACGAMLVLAGCHGNIGDYGGQTTPPGGALCDGSTPVTAKKRIVRLTFNQVTNSISVLLGTTIGQQIATDFEVVDVSHRTFPPLQNPREGAVVTDNTWDIGDRMAQEAAKYVADNFAAVTGCTTATDACAQQWVKDLATKAFRHPLTSDDTADVMKVYTDVKALGSTIQESTQYAVYSVLESPSFLYRTEIGDNAGSMGSLNPYELASAISYFLTDAPPDAPLLQAAAANQLSNRGQVQTQVDRLLATQAAKDNLHGAMMSYFAIPTLETIVVDSTANPAWNDFVRNSMYHESDLFLTNTLWSGKVNDLLTSTTSTINETLAPIYGVSWPPAGVALDADGFGAVSLPPVRAGMLTQGGFLVARARPMAGSVVGRGLLVNKDFLCHVNPAFPSDLADTISKVQMMLMNATEREKAAYRAANSPCMGCHPNFDPYGLSLENFDTIGQYRTTDAQGRPIDASVKLPDSAGGAMVNGAADLAQALASGTAFSNCIAKNMLNYALADVSSGEVTADSCAASAVTDAFSKTDGTFTSLMREVALSKTLAVRLAGGAQ